jgi:hypothetical protein
MRLYSTYGLRGDGAKQFAITFAKQRKKQIGEKIFKRSKLLRTKHLDFFRDMLVISWFFMNKKKKGKISLNYFRIALKVSVAY